MHMPAGRDEFAFQQGDAPGDVLRAQVQVHRRPVLERASFAGEQGEFDVDAARGALQRWGQQPVAAADLLDGQALAGEVQRHPLAGVCLVGFAILRMQAAHPHATAEWRQHEFIADLHATGEGSAGDHYAGAGDAESAVDGQAEIAAVATCVDVCRLVEQGLAQCVDTPAFDRGDREDRRARQGAGLQQFGDLLADFLDPRGFDPVDLGQRHQRPANAQ